MRYMRMLAGAALVLASMVLSAPAWAASPSVVGSVSDAVNLSGIRTVAVSGHYAYSPSYYNGELTAIDISNPAHPVITGESTPTAAVDNADFVTISGGYAYVTSKNANASPTSNDNGTGNSLSIFDIHTNPAAPVLVGTTPSDSTLFGAYGVAVSGHYALVTAQGSIAGEPVTPNTGGNDFDVIDVSNPASPAVVKSLPNTGGAFYHADAVTVAGNLAYVTASYSHTLTVVDISTPTTPSVKGTLTDATNLSFPNDVAVQGNYAYVANETGPTGSVAVVDISNPANPRVATTLSSTQLDNAYRIVTRGTFAYVAAARDNAIDLIDISNPLHPALAGSVVDGGHLNHTTGLDFALAGRYVIATSPLLSTETQTQFPPYPLSGGTSNTGTVSVLDMDPNPVAVHITSPASGASYKPGQSVTAGYTCTAGGLFAITTCQGPVASGAKVDTSTPGKHTFTVTGTDQDGQTGTATVTYTVLAPPAITHLKQNHRRWREHGKASRHLPPIGTAFTFTLNEKSRITLTFTRLVGPGRKAGKRCVVQTKKNRHHRRCERTAPAGKLTFGGKQGSNRIAFNGKIKGKFLKPGTYTVTITVTANGKSVSRTLTFTIVA